MRRFIVISGITTGTMGQSFLRDMQSTLKTAKKYLAITAVVGIVIVVASIALAAYHQSDLYVYFVTREAVRKNDASICMKLEPGFMSSQPSPELCVMQVVVQNRTIQSCVRKNTPYEYPGCFGSYFRGLPSKDLSICAVFQNQLTRDDCYFAQMHQFKEAKDATICSYLQDSYKKQLCKNLFDALNAKQ